MMGIHKPFLTSILTVALFFITTLPQQSHSQENDTYSICSQSFSCGPLENISYPFWGGNRPRFCGSDGFRLMCLDNQHTSIQVGSQKFSVLNINQTANTVRMVRTDLAFDSCSSSNFTNTSLSGSPFHFLPSVQNVTIFYDCPTGISTVGTSFTCQNDSNKHVFYVINNRTELQQFQVQGPQNCGVSVQVQASGDVALAGDSEALKKTLEQGFDVNYDAEWSSQCRTCVASGGACGSGMNENNSSQFSCRCPGGTHDSACPTRTDRKKNRVLKLVLGFAATGIGLPLIAVIICRNKAKLWKIIKTQFTKRNDRDIEAFLESQGPSALKRYTFSDVKKMTDSFKVKLGEGGYGAVYKGKLLNGSSVAVKVLNESKENGEEFINEVASISKTSHVNVVTLLGFCFEGSKKALIYEFMSNGSLEKFIYNKEAETTAPSLSWENLYQIAIGIARGLEYLHKGCNTRILHFDIKPHNILLDENYRPKISDFGLAKLSNRDESIISMSNARGTVGYVAPEVWNKSFGGVSHKSDVYSFGMMLLEMVGGQKNVNVEASRSSEIYFPHLVIYKKLELGSDLGLDGVMSMEENGIAKRMTMVGLWCIQTIPAHRPTISRVIEMLEGSMDSLKMPPKPVIYSPPRSAKFSTVSKSFDSV